MPLPNDTPEKKPTVYYLDQAMKIRSGTLGKSVGPDVWIADVRRQGNSVDHTRTRVPRVNIFTEREVGQHALDLMPLEPGGPRTFRRLLGDVLSDPASAGELSARLASSALERHLASSRPEAHYGVVPVDELIGSPDVSGSNLWKVKELVEGYTRGHYKRGTCNNLVLATALEPELDLLPPDQADNIRNKIATNNRVALDRIYDAQGVDYASATVRERILADATVERQTVYPFHGGECCFVELSDIGQTSKDSLIPTSPLVTVMIGQPEFNLES